MLMWGMFGHSNFFEPHFHLDNSLLQSGVNQSGTLREAIQLSAKKKEEMYVTEVMGRVCHC